MNLGLVPLAIATIGASYAALVLRGWRRRDNLFFGLVALTDAVMTAWRGLNVLTGSAIIAASVVQPCAIGTIVLALLTIEFESAFPRRPAMRWRWRAAMLAWGAARRTSTPYAAPTAATASVTIPPSIMPLPGTGRGARRTPAGPSTC